jgi:hypothetical protein
VDNLFLSLAALFAVGMMVLMIRYAKFIHNQPKMEEERRQNTNKENSTTDDQT